MCTGHKVPTLSHWMGMSHRADGALRLFKTTRNFTSDIHQGNQDLCVISLGQRALKSARMGSFPMTSSSKGLSSRVCVSVGRTAVSGTACSPASLSLPSPSDPSELQPWLFTLVYLPHRGRCLQGVAGLWLFCLLAPDVSADASSSGF